MATKTPNIKHRKVINLSSQARTGRAVSAADRPMAEWSALSGSPPWCAGMVNGLLTARLAEIRSTRSSKVKGRPNSCEAPTGAKRDVR